MVLNYLNYACHLIMISMKVYAGKEAVLETRVVMELIDPYLDFGRILIIDNWYYTSVELEEQLGNRKTYCIGTLRSNRKSNPKKVVNYKLQKSQCFSLILYIRVSKKCRLELFLF